VALLFLLDTRDGRNAMVGCKGAVPVVPAACFNRLTCVRWLLDNRLGFVWLILLAICVYSIS